MASLAGLAGHLPGGRPPRQRHHRAHPHLAADRPLFSDPACWSLLPGARLWTWAGAGLAGVALLISVAWPLVTAPPALEVTCLDTYGSLECVMVSPEGRRLVVTAPARSWPGRPGSSGGLSARCPPTAIGGNSAPWTRPWPWPCPRTMPGNCSPWPNSSTWGDTGTAAGATPGRPYGICGIIWATGGRLPLPLEPWRRGPQPPARLGSVTLNYLKLGEDKDFALGLSWSGRQVLILPPERQPAMPPTFQPAATGLDLLILPAALARSPDLPALLARLHPHDLVIYGGSWEVDDRDGLGGTPCHFTREGAVSFYLSPEAVSACQWGQKAGSP